MISMGTLGRAAALSFLASLAAACGSSPDAGAGGSGPSTGACAAKLDSCLVDQMSCDDSSGTATCVPCGDGEYAAKDGTCAKLDGTPTSHDFPDFTVDAGGEISGLCESWSLNNPEEIWVNAVEMHQDVAFHHSNWTFVPNTEFAGPDGVWTCADRSYDQLHAALKGGVLYAMSTQATREVQRFPGGAAIRIPPWSKIIGDVHILDSAPTPKTGHVTLAIYALAAADVKVKLTPFHLTYDGLAIPPHAKSRFSGTCNVDDKFQLLTKGPVKMSLYYVLPHTHALGTRFFLDEAGGASDGKQLIDVEGFDSGARGRAYDPPVVLDGTKGFTFGCEFENPRDDTIHYGIGNQEMCETLGFLESTVGFESSIADANPGPDDGATKTFSGSCSTVAFPWGFDSPGGTPPTP